ncbi:MAG: pirin family protein [Candidatus Nitronauta litoralis]|uniref:Pirin family protein n=1 Tax=Candidatus Nitronauta litoralis TaxID=2705533 RepID=A0A7T0G1A2_9BACT|nr:MAG: pirin family protein [Candidatus Nitronauta litoralis]
MSDSENYRTANLIVKNQRVSDGQGVKILRALGTRQLVQADPFLLLDEFKSDEPLDYIGGFPDHPHRGFQTVTYMLAGRMRHKDNKGHAGVLTPGSVQWMKAGRGIIHSEMPEQDEGLLHGFQLWVNLPASEKMSEPFYHEFSSEKIPTVSRVGCVLKVIAGKTQEGNIGAVQGITGDPVYLDVQLLPDSEFSEKLERDHTALLYMFEGKGSIVSLDKTELLETGNLAELGSGNRVKIRAGKSGCRFLLIASSPFKEPIARQGPFVMNTENEVRQAALDYATGNF